MADDRNGREPTNGFWRFLGPIALTLVLAMTGTYFVFLQNMATKDELDRQHDDLQRSIVAVTQDLRRVEGTQHQRSSSVSDVPLLRQEVVRLVAEMRAQEVRVEDLRSRVLLVEEALRKKSTTSMYLEEDARGTP